MGSRSMNFFRRLDRHSGALLLVGVAAALIANALSFQKARKAARRLREAPVASELPPSLPLVSFLVPAWNEAENIEACIHSILSLRYPNKELVLCAGGRDATLAICRRHAHEGVIILEQRPGEGKQGALRRCFERSTGEIIFLTDADCVVDDDCVEATLAPLLEGTDCVATGSRQPLRAQQQEPLVVYQWLHHAYLELSLPEELDFMYGINAGICRSALEQAGGFGESAPIGTDLDLAHRLRAAGYRIRYVRQSRVHTEYQVGISGYLHQQSRWFRNRLLLGLRFHAWHDVTSHLRAAAAACFMLGVPLTAGLGSRLVWSLWLAILIHLTLAQARLVSLAQGVTDTMEGAGSCPEAQRFVRVLPYMVVGWVALARGFLDSLLSGRRGRW